MKKAGTLLAAAALFAFTGCYSVFSGGTGGMVCDAESTSTPKTGIASVDVYAYTDCSARDSDYSNWKEGTVFYPGAAYYGHTTTASDGGFTISRIVWKSYSPKFGKDADTSTLYLLFYHENYGLTKGTTLIVSDSASDTVYQELTKVRKTTTLNISLKDVASDSETSKSIYVSVSVPQTTESNTELKPKVYDATITGNGVISVTYPRWQNERNREEEKETEPEVTVKYYQSAEDVEWIACNNGGDDGTDYSFMNDMSAGITKTIKNESYSITLYGKACVLPFPSISGIYRSDDSENGVIGDDNLLVEMTATDGEGNTIQCGSVSTGAQNIGTSEKQTHGNFSGLPSESKTWKDSSYTGKTASVPVKLTVKASDGTEKASLETEISSGQSSVSYTIR